MEVQKKIIELINNSYEVEISSFTDVTADNYKNGCEVNPCNYFEGDKISFNLDTLDNIQDILKDRIMDYLENNIFYYEKIKEDSFCIIDERLCINQLVNNNNYEPSENELKAWKKGEIDLYIQDINIYISINGIELNSDILALIFPDAQI